MVISMYRQFVEDYSIITIHGRTELYIENFKSISELTENSIRVKAARELVVIEGSGLLIEYMNKDDIKIIGNIEHIRLMEVMR